MKKKWFTFSNIFTAVMLLFVLSMVISPNVKGWAIQGLMKIGLFQPDMAKNSGTENSVPGAHAPAGDLLLKDETGKIISLSDQKGKVVFINFWATWCPPCIAEMPSIEKLYNQFKDNENVMFVMVDVDNNDEKSKAFMNKNGYNMPVFTAASAIPEAYFAGTLPTTAILNKAGDISFSHVGSADYSNPEVAEYIKKLAK